MVVSRSLYRTLLVLTLCTIVAILTSCKDKTSKNLQPLDANSLLAQVIEKSGGIQRWIDLERISFKKEFHLYKEDGTIELDRTELHSYSFINGKSSLIQWKENDTTYNLIEQDATLYQTKNQAIDTTVTRDQLQSKLNAATFVLGLPFTLTDDLAKKTYNGATNFEGTPAHELEVAFANSTDVWYMYYSQDTLDWLGYWVQTADHYSLVINEEMIEVEGFSLSQKRKSYRTDAQKNRLYLRADYEYSNFAID